MVLMNLNGGLKRIGEFARQLCFASSQAFDPLNSCTEVLSGGARTIQVGIRNLRERAQDPAPLSSHGFSTRS